MPELMMVGVRRDRFIASLNVGYNIECGNHELLRRLRK